MAPDLGPFPGDVDPLESRVPQKSGQTETVGQFGLDHFRGQQVVQEVPSGLQGNKTNSRNRNWPLN